jgi:hypothetical protein
MPTSKPSPQPKAKGAPLLKRSALVGKFPHIQHQPAPPDARCKLSPEVREQIVARMVLV